MAEIGDLKNKAAANECALLHLEAMLGTYARMAEGNKSRTVMMRASELNAYLGVIERADNWKPGDDAYWIMMGKRSNG